MVRVTVAVLRDGWLQAGGTGRCPEPSHFIYTVTLGEYTLERVFSAEQVAERFRFVAEANRVKTFEDLQKLKEFK